MKLLQTKYIYFFLNINQDLYQIKAYKSVEYPVNLLLYGMFTNNSYLKWYFP